MDIEEVARLFTIELDGPELRALVSLRFWTGISTLVAWKSFDVRMPFGYFHLCMVPNEGGARLLLF